jgi:ferredoxin-like protein FixX
MTFSTRLQVCYETLPINVYKYGDRAKLCIYDNLTCLECELMELIRINPKLKTQMAPTQV